MSGPCNWPIVYTGCSDTTVIEALSPADRSRVEGMAVEYLWNWTLKMFGTCEVTVRPCKVPMAGSTFWGGQRAWNSPHFSSSMVIPQGCGCSDSCGCGVGAATQRLPGPVFDVVEVVIGDEVVDPFSYRVDNGSLLVRTDGLTWPRVQNLEANSGPDTWWVTYHQGLGVPAGGQVAAGVLSRELALALCRSGSCQLPERIQTITRQGITMTLLDPFEGLDDGKTGIWVIDSWVASVTRPPRRASVRSPDFAWPRNRRRTG